MPSLVGTKIDKYDMLAEVGHGGMAVVYRGRDTVLDREVAVKVLHSHLADREESRARLQREAITVARLRHENILEIFDYSGPQQGESYIVTEFIHGPTLKEWLDAEHEPRPTVAAMIVHRLCHALSHAHRTGVVHRDIKPENVMIRTQDGCLKLMDFGIAQILDKQKLTLTGQLLGSPAYMAPELVSGKPLDKRTDLFSLGILLYQLATGSLPFSGRNPHEVLNRIADGEYPPPSTVCPMVDADLEAIIARTLSIKPDDRFQSAESLASELEEYLLEVNIEPSTEEIAGYFRNPEGYVHELDARVCEALMTRAQTAARDGYSSRAIRLLGRVIELDGSHREAKALLARLRKRARRTRQLLWGGATVAGVGLLAAGVMLYEPGSAPAEDPTLASAVPRAPSKAPATIVDPREPTQPPTPTPSPADAEQPEATDTPPQVTSRRPIGRAIKHLPEAKCKVRIKGAPVGARGHLDLIVGNTSRRVSGPTMDIQFIGPQQEVVARSAQYGGSTSVSQRECRPGKTIDLTVNPNPARVSFKNAPSNLSIKCDKGCPPETTENMSPSSFPPINIPRGRHDVNVVLTYKAEGFKTIQERLRLNPGSNSITVKMSPLDKSPG